MVEAPAAQGVVQVPAVVGGQDHDGWARGHEGSQLRHRDRGLAEELEEQRLELVVRPVDLVDQQHRRPRPVVPDGPQDRPFLEVLGAEQVRVGQLGPVGLGEPDGEELPLVVPLVEGFGGGQPLVALQADQRRVQREGEGLGRGRLPDSGFTFEEQGLSQPQRQEDRHRQSVVDQVVDRVEAGAHLLVRVHETSCASSRS